MRHSTEISFFWGRNGITSSYFQEEAEKNALNYVFG